MPNSGATNSGGSSGNSSRSGIPPTSCSTSTRSTPSPTASTPENARRWNAPSDPYVDRVEREPRLAIDYIAHRIPAMMPRYRQMMETVHAMISEAFSNAVIEPGVTTTDDVVWWLRQTIRDMGMNTWFQPSVSVQRAGGVPSSGPVVIERGDLVWTDVGLDFMGLTTDTQHNGYVLREGETEVPEGLAACASRRRTGCRTCCSRRWSRDGPATRSCLDPGEDGGEGIVARSTPTRSVTTVMERVP
jgi:hypothetical protein